jgi:hypothetical protein
MMVNFKNKLNNNKNQIKLKKNNKLKQIKLIMNQKIMKLTLKKNIGNKGINKKNHMNGF